MSNLSATEERRRIHARPTSVAIAGFFIGALVTLRVLVPAGWDPSAMASFGTEAQPTLDYAQARLDQVTARQFQGHDGKFFFVQANDPLVREPETHAAVLDRPAYRSQRMLYPLVAGLGGLLPASGIVWSLVVVNVLAMGLGAGALAAYAERLGLSVWFGLALPLNPGMIHELTVDGAGVLAFALVCGAALAAKNDRIAASGTLLVLAALTREVMLLGALGVGVWLWSRGKKTAAWWHVVSPLLAVLGWAGYLRLRLPGPAPAEVQEIGLPFVGLLGAVETWLENPAYLAVGIVVIIVMVLLISQMLRGRSDPLALVAAGFVGLAVVLTAQVWRAEFDITRAVAPVLTAVIVNPLFRTPSPSAKSTLEA